MWKWIKDAIVWAVEKLAGWLLDLFLWLFEWVYEVVNVFLSWLFNFAGEALLAVFTKLGEYIPAGLVDNITDAYVWLEYINNYIPVKLGITLLIAYYAIYLVVTIYRTVKSFIPFIGK